MKLTVTILLLVAASHAAEPPYRGKQNARDSQKTEKRELEEGSGSVDKRAPSISTVAPSPTPGIEYADSKESQQDKSPAQQVYATPAPQIAKISDVLTGQGPFQAAIASHLYSPISVYQARLGAPTTYEISPPIPSQLAYSEHKITYQPQPNAISVASPAPPVKVLPNYQPAYQQQFLVQPQLLPQPQPLSQPQHLVQHQPLVQPQPLAQPQQIHQLPHPQQFLQQIPQNYQPQFIQYVQGPPVPYQAPGLAYIRNQIQLPYLQAPQHLIPIPVQIPPPGFFYAQNPNHGQQNLQIIQKPQQVIEPPHLQPQLQLQQQQPQQVIVKEQELQQQQQKPNIQIQSSQPQGAVSYASFSQSQPSPSYQIKQQPPQSFQPLQYQQPRVTLQLRSQPLNTQVKPEGDESLQASSSKSIRPVSYFRPGANLQPAQQQQLQKQALPQQQSLPQQQLLLPNPGFAGPALNVSPTFPPVQYFGKHAQRIFARYSVQP
ncbi:uncharacterized protein LOC106135675 [Amyelois transitella]|uniref:uncharacterized protein LOC106135675 n=1 Tax=Amyelois transitella TaxID=680683 RepID=UPI00067E13EE|nr:uncharacterized protein LOC106135675 [Amyelois transitella]